MDLEHLAKYFDVRAKAKEFILSNFDEIVEDLTSFEEHRTSPLNVTLQKAVDILMEVEEVYALGDVYEIVADIKYDRAMKR